MTNIRYVFFDTESSHNIPNTGFTQLLEITAILVDPENFEIEDVLDEKCRLNKTNFLSPGASFTNNLTEENLRQNMSSYELSRVINKKFSEWRQKYNIYWIAWNNNFDRGIFRVANAYMNLQLDDLYFMNTKSPSGNFNYEIDALSFAHALQSFGKSDLKVPLHPNTGKPSFQLGLICDENSIKAEGELHTAIVDTKLMMNFVKKYSKQDPEIWKQMQQTAHKERVSDLLSNSKNYFLSTFFMRGNEYLYTYSYCGMGNDGSAIFVDLKNFTEDDFLLSPAEISKRKDDRKNRIFRKIYLNKNPILIDPKVANLSKEQIGSLGNLEEIQKMHENLENNNQYKNKIVSAFTVDNDEMFAKKKSEYYEDMIYESFFTNSDKALAREFHQLDEYKDKYKKIKAFTDMRMVHIAKKIIYDNEPSVMSQSDIRDIEHQIANRLLSENYEYRNYLTIETAKDELEKICKANEIDNDDLNNNKNSNPDLPNEKFQLLVSARTYIENKEKELEAMR
jgi:hypothetical protein